MNILACLGHDSSEMYNVSVDEGVYIYIYHISVLILVQHVFGAEFICDKRTASV